MLQSMGSQRVVHDLGTEQQQQNMGNEDINYGIMGQSDKASILHVLHAFLVLTKQRQQQQNTELCSLLCVQSNLREKDKISACQVQVGLLHNLR